MKTSPGEMPAWPEQDLHTWQRYLARTTTAPCNCKVVLDNGWYASQPNGVTTPVRTTAGIVERDAEVEHEVIDDYVDGRRS